MAQRTTVSLNLQSASSKQELTSLFQIAGVVLTSPQVTTLSINLQPGEIRDLTEALSKVVTAPASANDPDVIIQFIAVKADSGFDISLLATTNPVADIYTGINTTLYFKTFKAEGERLNHFKVKAGSTATSIFIVIGHGSITT